MDRFDIISRLAAVEAVEGRGATAGEREAARQARLRLESRLAENPPWPTAFAEEMAHGAHLRPAPERASVAARSTELPGRKELASRLRAVRGCPQSSAVLVRWAARLVDRVVLPQLPPDDPDSVVPEVLLVLASGTPASPVVDAMIRFLECAPDATVVGWQRWFAELEAELHRGPG